MKGFIFGFQRFVWCPKWTPASNNSGTNSVVSAIKRNSRGRELPEREREDATPRARAQPEIRRSREEGKRRFQLALEIKSDSQPHVIFFVLVPKNVIVVHGELFVFVTESLSNWQLMKEPQR